MSEQIEYTHHNWSWNGEDWKDKLIKALNIEGSAGWRVVHMAITKDLPPKLGARVRVYMMRINK